MKKLELAELRKIQIGILDTVHSFCIQHNIQYWLDCGSLLGAIKFKGYIPWDDDIDIGMLRPDYYRFMELFNKENTRYQFRCIESDKTFMYPFGKVLDTRTVLYEPDQSGRQLSVYVDVFVYDNAPDDDKIVSQMFRTRDFCHKMRGKYIAQGAPNGNIIRRCAVYIARPCLKLLIPERYWNEKMVRNAKRFSSSPAERVGCFVEWINMVCSRECLNEFIDVEFEGKWYKAPIGYDRWLRALYGDYTLMPPPEKRVSHHRFEAYSVILEDNDINQRH